MTRRWAGEKKKFLVKFFFKKIFADSPLETVTGFTEGLKWNKIIFQNYSFF